MKHTLAVTATVARCSFLENDAFFFNGTKIPEGGPGGDRGATLVFDERTGLFWWATVVHTNGGDGQVYAAVKGDMPGIAMEVARKFAVAFVASLSAIRRAASSSSSSRLVLVALDARARYRERHESAFWRERHYMYWSQTWLNGTADGEPVRSDGGSALSDPGAIAALGEDTYRGCLDRCGLTCAALAGDPARAEAPGAFDELYYSAFQQREGFVRDRGGNERRPQWEDDDMTYDRYYPSACFTSNDFWEEWGYTTWRSIIWFVFITPFFCAGYVLACCQSHRCCPWFTPLMVRFVPL